MKKSHFLLGCTVEPVYPHSARKQRDAWLLPGQRLWDSSPGVSQHRGAVYNTHRGEREPCPPVILRLPVHLFINKSNLVPGQSPIFHSSLLWNLSRLQVAGTLVLHLIWMTGPAKGILSPDTLQGHWFCMDLEYEQCHLLNHKYHLLEQFFFYVSHLISIAQFSQLLGRLITFSFKELKFNFIQARY